MPKKSKQEEALAYHAEGRKGKIEVVSTKPASTQRDLSLAYSPGVAAPCNEIADTSEKVYEYTAKGNLVAVISNGTAVLGLGNIGPLASKPVMEGKGVLFKTFADLDVFDIEINETDPDKFVEVVKAISPTFGGINLEDIKSPEAFHIEKRLVEELDIPIMHDDQHGTAIISGAALLNALELAGKKIDEVRVVISGAGAAALSCARLYIQLGVRQENILMTDSKGVINSKRENLDELKKPFATKENVDTLEQAMKGADVFLGLSTGNIVSAEMLKSMAPNPIVFACANPDPEIPYSLAVKTRKDVIMATGRSDHPNQVNNVLGFPYIFRGAMDVRATTINDEMKMAAVMALAKLAKEPVPEEVNEAYGEKNLAFGRENIIPKPFDPRLVTFVSKAVAKAAMETGVAKNPITDWEEYDTQLKRRLGLDKKLINNMIERAKRYPKKVVFAEADEFKVLKAAQLALEEGVVSKAVLLGKKEKIERIIKENKLHLEGAEILDPREGDNEKLVEKYTDNLYALRQRKGLTRPEAKRKIMDRYYFGSMMVKAGTADAMVAGMSRAYPAALRPALETIGASDFTGRVAGMYVVTTKQGPLFFADVTVSPNPTAEELVEICLLTNRAVKQFGFAPRLALVSYSNFDANSGEPAKIKKAVEILHQDHPEISVDGNVQANFALNPELTKEKFPFSILAKKKANTLIFPNLASGNIAYKLLDELSDAHLIGPILMGMDKPVQLCNLGCSVTEVFNMATLAVLDAQSRK